MADWFPYALAFFLLGALWRIDRLTHRVEQLERERDRHG